MNNPNKCQGKYQTAKEKYKKLENTYNPKQDLLDAIEQKINNP